MQLLFIFVPRILLWIAVGIEYFTKGSTPLLGILVILLFIRYFINGSRQAARGLGKASASNWATALAIIDLAIVGAAVYSYIY